MSTATINQAVNKLTDHVSLPGAENKFSTYKAVICIATDKESLEGSTKLLEHLQDIIENKLPVTDEDFVEEDVKDNLENINENLQKVDSLLQFVNKAFKEGPEVEIDDDTTLELLSNMEQVQKKLLYISDYLNLVLEVQKAKKEIQEGNFKEFSLDEVLKLINAA